MLGIIPAFILDQDILIPNIKSSAVVREKPQPIYVLYMTSELYEGSQKH